MNEEVKANFKKYFNPMWGQLIISGIMNSIDKVIALLFIGAQALVATSLSAPLLILLFAFARLFGSGLASYIGIMKGRNQEKQASEVMSFVLLFLTIISFVLAGFGWFFSDSLAEFFGGKTQNLKTFSDMSVYLQYLSLSLVPVFLGTTLDSCIMNDGSPKYVAFSKSMMGISNVIFSTIFIMVFKMGVAGLGLGTFLSTMVSFLISLFYMAFKSPVVHFTKPAIDFKSLFKIMYNGSSEFLSLASIGVSIFAINYSFVHYLPVAYLKAYSIVVIFTIFIRHPYMASSMGIQPVLSTAFGAKNFSLLKAQIRYNLIRPISYALLLYFALMPIVWLSAQYLKIDSETARIIPIIYLGLGLTFILISVTLQVPTFYTAIGRPLESLLFSLSRSLVLVPSLIIILVKLLGLYGLFLAYMSTDIFLTFVILWYMKHRDMTKLSSVV